LYTANNYAFAHAAKNEHIETCIFLEQLYAEQNLLSRISHTDYYIHYTRQKNIYYRGLYTVLHCMSDHSMFDPNIITLVRQYN
jgi:hypothetical protein